MEIIARYLPQFHRIPENDMWWGEGYTEWTAVKKASALFEGQNQPRKPYGNYYYDLSDIETLKWQVGIAKEYGVDGFSFYHYWFDSENNLLKKPAEMLLNNADIEIDFCFTWANETWARSWSNISKKNTWNDNEKKGYDSEKDGILMLQKYGGKKEWEKHIKYLIPFFKDQRYIKYGNRPVFIIYSVEDILCLDEMIDCWNKLLAEHEIENIYIINETRDCISGSVYADADMVRFPTYAINRMKKNCSIKNVNSYDYDECWKYTIECAQTEILDKTRYVCAAVDYDDTARRGKGGCFLKGVTPLKFEKYMEILISICKQKKLSFLFVNAWNEWGEGMYLEPDERWGYGFLQALKNAKKEQNKKNYSLYLSDMNEYEVQEYAFFRNQYYKEKTLHNIYYNWIKLHANGINIYKKLTEKKYNTIAIYGVGEIGRLLFEYNDGIIDIVYYIDRNLSAKIGNVPVLSLDDTLPVVDMIIISLVGQDVSKIKKRIRDKVGQLIDVYSIEQLMSKYVEELR